MPTPPPSPLGKKEAKNSSKIRRKGPRNLRKESSPHTLVNLLVFEDVNKFWDCCQALGNPTSRALRQGGGVENYLGVET